jgi:hypothetical protein
MRMAQTETDSNTNGKKPDSGTARERLLELLRPLAKEVVRRIADQSLLDQQKSRTR